MPAETLEEQEQTSLPIVRYYWSVIEGEVDLDNPEVLATSRQSINFSAL
jgi:hypothetical protein